MIDAEFLFNGVRATEVQALQWPRERCPDPDRGWLYRVAILSSLNNWLPADAVPKIIVDATCEMARELLIADRTAAPAGEGLKYDNTAANQIGYDKTDRRPVISHFAQAMLAKFGSLLKSRSGAVRLVRA